MEKNWQYFQDFKGGKHAARGVFNELCEEVLKKHYPAQNIMNAENFTGNEESEKHLVLYLAKFFTDELTNSRKGQIRKSFNDTVEHLDKTKHAIFSWIVCLPYRMSDDDIVWWHNWKAKMHSEYGINITLFADNKLIEMLEKHNLLEKWFNPEVQSDGSETKEKEENEEDDIFEFALDSEFISISSDQEKLKDENKEENQPEKELKVEDKIETIEENHTEKKSENEEKNEEEKQPEKINPQDNIDELQQKDDELDDTVPDSEMVAFSENAKIKQSKSKKEIEIKYNYADLKAEYKKISDKIDDLSKEEKEIFKIIHAESKIFEGRFKFSFEDDEKKQLTTDLYYFAKLNLVNGKHEKALVYYEEILTRDDLEDVVSEEDDDIRETINTCGEEIKARNLVTEGDYYTAKNEMILALDCYEKAYKINNENNIYYTKYNETYGDSLLDENLFLEARKKYKKALKYKTDDDFLNDKNDFAKYMIRGNKTFSKGIAKVMNPLLSPYYYNKAAQIFPENEYLKRRQKKAIKKLFYGVMFVAAIVVLFFVLKSIPPLPNKNTEPAKAQKMLTLYDVAMQKGDYYYKNFSNANAHYLDSAMINYYKAIFYKPQDSLAPKMYEETQKRRELFIADIQAKIKLDSAAYFVSMRNESEGLRLAKFLFEPYDISQGKYGYVDADMNIVIPPIYDFNPTKMNNVGESFKKGKALVCLKISRTDTIYFLIDNEGDRISKKYKGIK